MGFNVTKRYNRWNISSDATTDTVLTRNPSGRNKGSQSTPRRKEEAPKVSTRFSRTTADSFPAHMSGRQQQRRRATAARTARRFLTIVFVAKIPTSPGGRRQTRGRGDARTLSSLSQPTKTNPAAVSQRGCARGGRRLVRLRFFYNTLLSWHTLTHTNRHADCSYFQCYLGQLTVYLARTQERSLPREAATTLQRKPIDALRRTLSTGPIFQAVRGR